MKENYDLYLINSLIYISYQFTSDFNKHHAIIIFFSGFDL